MHTWWRRISEPGLNLKKRDVLLTLTSDWELGVQQQAVWELAIPLNNHQRPTGAFSERLTDRILLGESRFHFQLPAWFKLRCQREQNVHNVTSRAQSFDIVSKGKNNSSLGSS